LREWIERLHTQWAPKAILTEGEFEVRFHWRCYEKSLDACVDDSSSGNVGSGFGLEPAGDCVHDDPGQGSFQYARGRHGLDMGGLLFDINWQVKMSPAAGIPGTWQASIFAPAGTIIRYFYTRNDNWNLQEMYIPFSMSQDNYRELVMTNGATGVALILDISP